jgi:hypothetical protein
MSNGAKAEFSPRRRGESKTLKRGGTEEAEKSKDESGHRRHRTSSPVIADIGKGKTLPRIDADKRESPELPKLKTHCHSFFRRRVSGEWQVELVVARVSRELQNHNVDNSQGFAGAAWPE